MSVLNSLLTPETMKAHRATWWACAWGGQLRTRLTKKMRGVVGFDVTCSCGWDSKTGGAVRRYVEDELWHHRYSAQQDAAILALPCPQCRAEGGQKCTDLGKERSYFHVARIEALP